MDGMEVAKDYATMAAMISVIVAATFMIRSALMSWRSPS